jgi:transcriptional regulator
MVVALEGLRQLAKRHYIQANSRRGSPMYQPPHFREDRIEVQHDLIRAHPLGLLVTGSANGLMANFIPFLVNPAAGLFGTLRAHLARANPQWHELAAVSECLVVFQGPQTYLTPSWYATKRETGKVVPTWNYVTVHAWGVPKVIEDAGWLRQQIGELTASRETQRTAPWSVEDAPADFVASQIKGIVGLEVVITRIEGKWKVSQNRPEVDRQSVVQGLRAEAGEADPMAALVASRGAKP